MFKKRWKLKNYFLALILLAGIFLVAGCDGIRSNSKVDQWGRIKKEKRVIVGVDDTFVPMGN